VSAAVIDDKNGFAPGNRADILGHGNFARHETRYCENELTSAEGDNLNGKPLVYFPVISPHAGGNAMIDRERLAELRHEVGTDDLTEVIALFCEEVEETLDRIITHPSASLGDDLHFLKGSALNIGMSEVGQLCLEAEKAWRKDAPSLPDIATIAQAFRKARQALYLELDA
jgi:HPt (histidine-containing phosphotransfer) domain-containing protein